MRFLGAFLMCAAAACTSSTSVADDPANRAQVRDGHTRGQALADQASAELASDPQDVLVGKIAVILHALDDGELNEAQLVSDAGTTSDVTAFATQVATDHDEMDAQLDQVERDQAIVEAQSGTGDAVMADYGDELATLRAASPDQLPVVYVELQVRGNAEAQVLLARLAELDPFDDQFATTLAQFRDMVDAHLGDAEDLLHMY